MRTYYFTPSTCVLLAVEAAMHLYLIDVSKARKDIFLLHPHMRENGQLVERRLDREDRYIQCVSLGFTRSVVLTRSNKSYRGEVLNSKDGASALGHPKKHTVCITTIANDRYFGGDIFEPFIQCPYIYTWHDGQSNINFAVQNFAIYIFEILL